MAFSIEYGLAEKCLIFLWIRLKFVLIEMLHLNQIIKFALIEFQICKKHCDYQFELKLLNTIENKKFYEKKNTEST